MNNKRLSLIIEVFFLWITFSKISVAGEWVHVNAGPHWSPRCSHTSVIFQDKIWVIGGFGTNFVWSSSDGAVWEEVTAHAQWLERDNPGSVVFENNMWVIGGVNSEEALNDVWFSSDGAVWTEAVESNLWSLGRFP